MKILHITDSHGTVKSPASRLDAYYISFLEKFYELGYIIRQQGIDMIIHTGDLFHTSRVSDKFTGQLAEIIKSYNIPMYVVPGNHDIDGYNLDTIDQTKLGLLYKTGVVKELDRDNPIEITFNGAKISIAGQEYYANIDEGNKEDFEMQTSLGDLNILCIHGYVVTEQQPAEVKCTYAKDILTDADIILSGHFHRSVVYECDDFAIYNPGSMMRVEQTEYNKTHIPQYGILEIDGDAQSGLEYEYTFHKFRVAKPVSAVFDYNAKYISKANSITLEGFKNSIANTMTSVHQNSFSVQNIIAQIISNDPNLLPEEGIAINNAYIEMVQNMPEEYTTRKGYVESDQPFFIKRVEINNFQSHAHTIVDFDSGMNIIVGESNSGKTSIFRAIMWAIDNRPLGTDFITSGANTCSVEIEFSNGYKLIRSKTTKDSGSYIVVDPNNNKSEYKGFTNNVPVEVDNCHQMPIVQISKDISTHLNVMSQLDSPFMITDSPQNRAIAIGRITGVHVIDAAIKKANSEMLSANKEIKVLTKIVTQQEKDLASRHDLKFVDECIKSFRHIMTYVIKEKKKMFTTASYLKEIQDSASQIGVLKINVEKLSTISDFDKNVIGPIGLKVKNLHQISDIHDKFTSISDEVSDIQNKICSLTNASHMNPILKKADELYKFIHDLEQITANYNLISADINKEKDTIDILKAAHHLMSLSYTHFEYKYNTTVKLIQLQECYETNNNYIKQAKNDKKNAAKKLDGAFTSLWEFVTNNGVCPCCGKPIDDNDVNAKNTVVQFFTGKKDYFEEGE